MVAGNFNPRQFTPKPRRTFQPQSQNQLFNPKIFNPRLFNHKLFSHDFLSQSFEKSGIYAPDFSTRNFSTPWFKKSWFKNSFLKSPGLKSLGLRSGNVVFSTAYLSAGEDQEVNIAGTPLPTLGVADKFLLALGL